MKKKLLHISMFIVAAALSASAVFAQSAGELDLTFGTQGLVLTDHITNTGEVYADMITLSDDKIVIVGYSNGNNPDIILAKYKADGTADSTFGINGFIAIDASIGGLERGLAVKELTGGKLLVAGTMMLGGIWDGFIMRLNSDGTVDNTFGTTASGRTNFNAGDSTNASGVAIEVLSDNSIYVGAQVKFGNQADLTVFKFTQGGGLNVSFASGGYAHVDIDGEDDALYAMALTANEEIILAGESDSMGVERGIIAKLSQFGTPSTFNNSMGYFAFDAGSGKNELRDVKVDGNGKLVAVGSEGTGTNVNGIILRLNADGTLDNTFSSDGYQQSDPGATVKMYLTNVFITTEGGIMTTGYTVATLTQEIYAFLMNENGSPDSDFGGNGDANIQLSITTTAVNGKCSAMQSNGKILLGGDVAGSSFVGNNLFITRMVGVSGVGVNEISKVAPAITFPNPATDHFSVQDIDAGKFEKIELLSLEGKLMHTWTNAQKLYSLPAQVSTGNYLVKIYTNGAVYSSKLAVVK